MQPSTVTLSSPLCNNDCCEESIQSQSKERQQTKLSSNCHGPIAIIALAITICLVIIFSLLAGAFSADSGVESSAACDDSFATETSQAVIAFVAGWLFCFLAKRRQELVDTIAGSADKITAFASSSATSTLSAVTFWLRSTGGSLWNNGPRMKSILAMTLVCAMCSACILGLFISAFTAVPYEEPADSGFASESSSTMKVFTIGWMFMLSFKLRRELVGVVGSSCLLQPC